MARRRSLPVHRWRVWRPRFQRVFGEFIDQHDYRLRHPAGTVVLLGTRFLSHTPHDLEENSLLATRPPCVHPHRGCASGQDLERDCAHSTRLRQPCVSTHPWEYGRIWLLFPCLACPGSREDSTAAAGLGGTALTLTGVFFAFLPKK